MSILISRRDLLKHAGLAGAAAAIVPRGALGAARLEPAAGSSQSAGAGAPFEHFSPAESEILEAFVARLIPSDATGPGAREARAARYIDRALGGALASSRPAYAAGLAALDQYARAARGRAFAALPAGDQDAVLADVQSGAAGFPSSSAFFELVRVHTLQGTFCDPYYGGNANFVGWDLIGYPGVRTTVAADEQRLGVAVTPNHKSAYDYEMFTKASASAARSEGGRDGD